MPAGCGTAGPLDVEGEAVKAIGAGNALRVDSDTFETTITRNGRTDEVASSSPISRPRISTPSHDNVATLSSKGALEARQGKKDGGEHFRDATSAAVEDDDGAAADRAHSCNARRDSSGAAERQGSGRNGGSSHEASGPSANETLRRYGRGKRRASSGESGLRRRNRNLTAPTTPLATSSSRPAPASSPSSAASTSSSSSATTSSSSTSSQSAPLSDSKPRSTPQSAEENDGPARAVSAGESRAAAGATRRDCSNTRSVASGREEKISVRKQGAKSNAAETYLGAPAEKGEIRGMSPPEKPPAASAKSFPLSRSRDVAEAHSMIIPSHLAQTCGSKTDISEQRRQSRLTPGDSEAEDDKDLEKIGESTKQRFPSSDGRRPPRDNRTRDAWSSGAALLETSLQHRQHYAPLSARQPKIHAHKSNARSSSLSAARAGPDAKEAATALRGPSQPDAEANATGCVVVDRPLVSPNLCQLACARRSAESRACGKSADSS